MSDLEKPIDAAADRIVDRLADRLIERVATRICAGMRPAVAGSADSGEIVRGETAKDLWKAALPREAKFGKDVDLALLVELYPLTASEIQGAVERAFKHAGGYWPGKPPERKKSRSERLTLRDEHLRIGILWALGDRVLLDRINALQATAPGDVCGIDYWCEEHRNQFSECFDNGRSEFSISSYCRPSEGKTGFECPGNVGFDCNRVFRCSDGERFVFVCGKGGHEQFKCTSSIFDCRWGNRDSENNTFDCAVGGDKNFDCKEFDQRFECTARIKFKIDEPEPEPKPVCPKHPFVET